MPFWTERAIARLAWFVIVSQCAVTSLVAQAGEGHSHQDGEATHHEGLHFAHPLFTESVSPDRKVRLNVGRGWEAEGSETELELEGEWTITRVLSLEVGAPFVRLQNESGPSRSRLGAIEATLKLANYAFESSGLLLGSGFAVGFPTGSEESGIGSDHLWELEPFLNAGLRRGRLELVGWVRFGIPTNAEEGEETESELHYDLSGLLRVMPRVQFLLELNGVAGLGGHGEGHDLVTIAPGIKVAPLASSRLMIGAGLQLPLNESELDAHGLISLFYHF